MRSSLCVIFMLLSGHVDQTLTSRSVRIKHSYCKQNVWTGQNFSQSQLLQSKSGNLVTFTKQLSLLYTCKLCYLEAISV